MRFVAVVMMAFAVLAGVAAGGVRANGTAAADPLAGSEWRPVEIGGQAVGDGDKRLIRFGAEGKVTGHGGCNRFFGNATAEGGNLTFSPLASTKMACPEPLMSAEQAFLAALQQTRSFERDRARLVLRDAGGETIMRLAQTDWD